MSTAAWVAIVVAVVVVVALVAWAAARRRRTNALRGTFGNEYDRVVDVRGGRRDAERELAERKERREQIDLRPLSPVAAERYTASWKETQARFVDVPAQAVQEADTLITSLLREVGYPVHEFEAFDEQADVLSVDHPDIVTRYRSAHQVAERNAANTASTEDLRRAMVDYRAMFEEVLDHRVEA